MKLVAQEAPLGCAIACSASLANLSYRQMRRYFAHGERKERTSGFYNRDIIAALEKVGIRARARNGKRWGKKKLKSGTIVFIERSEKYPAGHYILKTKNGWMNPWINYPNIHSAKAGFQKKVPGKIQWILES